MTDDNFYVPDPAADAEFIVEGFLKALAQAPSAVAGAGGAIRQRAAELERQHAGWCNDVQSQANLHYACAVLAGYEVLVGGLAASEVLSTLTDAFTRSGAFVRDKTVAGLDQSTDAFRELVNISKQPEVVRFGAGFAFERERDDDKAYVLDVYQCFWHDFFLLLPKTFPDFGSALEDGK
jgi:hypothetical protein